MERILASFPRFAGAGFGSLTTETFCRPFSAVFGPASQSRFSVVRPSVTAWPPALTHRLQEPGDCSGWTRSGKSERGALSAPVERKAGVGHKLVRGEIDGLFTVEDRRDDIRREIVQSGQASGIRPAHVSWAATSSTVEPGFSARRLISI